MGDFGDAERRILALMKEGTEFTFQGGDYKVVLSGKPTCHKGEPKTDIYILAKSASDEAEPKETEIKISYKKENADFIENKMSAERAEQLFGENWMSVIERSTSAVKEKFEKRALIYRNKYKRTEKGAITLGWKYELLNKISGELSGKLPLTEDQIVDVYAGSNLSEDKRNAMVGGRTVKDSGVANYILMDEGVTSAQEVIDRMIPVPEYVKGHPNIYFACKALNYRTFKKKWDGDRPLSVFVRWSVEENRLVPELVYDNPLVVKGNEVADRLLSCLDKLKIKTTDDLNDQNVGTDRMV